MRLDDVGTLLALAGIILTIVQSIRKKQARRRRPAVPAMSAVEGPAPQAAEMSPFLTPAALAMKSRPVSARPAVPPNMTDPVAETEPRRVIDLFRQPASLAAALVAGEILAPPLGLRDLH